MAEREWWVNLCCGHSHLLAGSASSVPVAMETLGCAKCDWQPRHVLSFREHPAGQPER